jgi:hypothetical protein
MSREPFTIEITHVRNPLRAVVTVMPRTVSYHPEYFTLDEHANEYAAELRDRTGFPIIDQRQGRVQ